MYDAGAGYGMGWGVEERGGYGLNDPALAGFNPFKVIAAPFKAAAKVVKFGVKTAVKVAPRTVAGFLAAGPAGALAGGASALVGGGGGADPGYDMGTTAAPSGYWRNTQTGQIFSGGTPAIPPTRSFGWKWEYGQAGSGQYPNTSFNPTNPYSAQSQPYGPGMYVAPREPQPSIGDQLKSVALLLKDELLASGARAVASTPQGQQAIRQQVTGDLGRYLLPISLGAGALVLTLALTRR